MTLITLGDLQAGLPSLPLFIVIMAGLWFILVLFSLKTYGWKPTFRYFVPMIIASLFLEGSAVAAGRYTYEGYLLYISALGGLVPLIILLGWSANLFIFTHISTRIMSYFSTSTTKRSLVATAALAGIIGVAVDLFEDPLAHHNHWWTWAETTNELQLFNVPLSNYVDWFLILFFMALATLLIEHSSVSENRKMMLSFFSIPLLGGLIFFSHTLLTMIL